MATAVHLLPLLSYLGLSAFPLCVSFWVLKRLAAFDFYFCP